ncbi:MAG: TRAP transporter small permease [Burkholderiales bacterium]|nr:MAG: TRAP transporter small permease [Burkholderiales bacterium]
MRWTERLEEGLLALLLAAMVSITFMQVIARYVFNYSFVWALEVTTVLFAWLIFLGMSYGVRVGSHIGVDALVKSLGPRTSRIVASIATVLCIVYAVIVTVGGYVYVKKMYDVGILMQDVPIEQWIPRLVLPVGYALLALRFGQVLVRLARGKEVHLLGDEAEEALKLRADQPPGGEQK